MYGSLPELLRIVLRACIMFTDESFGAASATAAGTGISPQVADAIQRNKLTAVHLLQHVRGPLPRPAEVALGIARGCDWL